MSSPCVCLRGSLVAGNQLFSLLDFTPKLSKEVRVIDGPLCTLLLVRVSTKLEDVIVTLADEFLHGYEGLDNLQYFLLDFLQSPHSPQSLGPNSRNVSPVDVVWRHAPGHLILGIEIPVDSFSPGAAKIGGLVFHEQSLDGFQQTDGTGVDRAVWILVCMTWLSLLSLGFVSVRFQGRWE